jgi:hypothetical protein
MKTLYFYTRVFVFFVVKMSKFWKPGTFPRSDQDRSYLNENEWVPTISKEKLPILEKSLQILYLVEKYQVVVISSETGSGKTTQIPQLLLDHGWAQGGRYFVLLNIDVLQSVSQGESQRLLLQRELHKRERLSWGRKLDMLLDLMIVGLPIRLELNI